MSKNKLIALFLLITVALMGVGYAYWSETLAVNGTVTTGELRVEFQKYDDMYDVGVPYILYNNSTKKYRESRIAPFTISDDKHTLTAGFTNVFPGMYYSIPLGMQNKGTLPAVFKSCTVTSDIDDSTLNGLSESALLNELNANLMINYLELLVYNNSNQVIKSIVCVNGTPIPLSQLESTVNNALKTNSVRLEPGQYVQLTSNDGKVMGGSVEFLFGTGFSNDFQNKKFNVTINTEWKQFNQID